MITKPIEQFDSARVLGLQIGKGRICRQWGRGNDLTASDFNEKTTRRQLFSLCGKLLGHYPIASWLRVACGFVKRHSGGSKWDDDIGDVAQKMLGEIIAQVKDNDPVTGVWHVAKVDTGVV